MYLNEYDLGDKAYEINKRAVKLQLKLPTNFQLQIGRVLLQVRLVQQRKRYRLQAELHLMNLLKISMIQAKALIEGRR